jgi:hypothetical protein
MKLAELAPEAAPVGSPFDFRIGSAHKLEETDVRSAIESGEWGCVFFF